MDWTNPLPLALGGGPTDIESTWRALRALVGEHGAAPVDSIEDLADQAIARRVAAAERAIERAFFQAFPGIATDALPVWEELLLVAGADDDTQLRAFLEAAWRPREGSTTPSLEASLQAISTRLAILIEDDDATTTTIAGKYLAPVDNVPPFYSGASTRTAAVFPGYASTDVLRVTYTLPSGETLIPDDVLASVTDLLQVRLPSWQTWTITTIPDDEPAPVFLLDGGPRGDRLLDVTPLG